MHAFLVVGNNKQSQDIGGKPLEFTLEKIEDARELAKFTNLSLSQKVIIVLKDIEEPQENLYYIFDDPKHWFYPTYIKNISLFKGESLKIIDIIMALCYK